MQAKSFPNSKKWLSGLKDSCTYGGKLLGVPYYTGARAVIYRKDYYSAAGLKGTPKTLDQFVADGKKLMKKYGTDRNFSAFYFPGKNWYASMGFVYDYGGQIAVRKGGKWKGTLNSPQAIRALTKLKCVVRALSRARKPRTKLTRSSPVFGKGRWLVRRERMGVAVHARPEGRKSGPRTVMAAYPMPSHIKGRFMPTFLGGSDLAVPVTTKKSLAVDWIAAFTTLRRIRAVAKAGNIPNATSLARLHERNPKVEPFAKAAKYSWFIPKSPNWANVENANVLQDMCSQDPEAEASP